MSQVVRSLLLAAALLVHASPSFSEPGSVPMQLPKILVSTFNPENDPESGGVFAIRMWRGSRSKGVCNQDQRVLIVAVPEHFELHGEFIEVSSYPEWGHISIKPVEMPPRVFNCSRPNQTS